MSPRLLGVQWQTAGRQVSHSITAQHQSLAVPLSEVLPLPLSQLHALKNDVKSLLPHVTF